MMREFMMSEQRRLELFRAEPIGSYRRSSVSRSGGEEELTREELDQYFRKALTGLAVVVGFLICCALIGVIFS